MKTFEAVSRFIGCIILSYVSSTLFAFLLFQLFGTPTVLSGAIIGGGTVGFTVYYYQRRKRTEKIFVQSC